MKPLLTLKEDPSRIAYAALEEHYPSNPFVTEAFALSQKRLGRTPIVLCQGTEVITSGFIRDARFGSALEIPSFPLRDFSEQFWDELGVVCSRAGIGPVRLDSYDSGRLTLPRNSRETARRKRREYVLSLLDSPTPSFSHQRNIRRAAKKHLVVHRREDVKACRHHSFLLKTDARASGTKTDGLISQAEIRSLIFERAGTLFQTVDSDNHVQSSALVLLGKKGVYLHSAGSAGNVPGALHFLIAKIISFVGPQGFHHFNLGGASTSGIAGFKRDFGSTEVTTEALELDFSSLWQRHARTLVGAFKA